MSDCDLCEGETSCGQVNPKSGVICTRSMGHRGQHAACGHVRHPWERWARSENDTCLRAIEEYHGPIDEDPILG